MITNTILRVPYYTYSIKGPQNPVPILKALCYSTLIDSL